MLFRPVNAQALARDFEFPRGIAKRHEGQDPDQNANRVCLDTFQRANIDSLRIVAQPVAKIHALDHHRRPLVSLETRDRLEHVLYIAMAPVVAFDLGDRGDVPSSKCCCGRG